MKALASDIDGTLVFNQQIKKQDREAIEKYQKEHLFGVCSGRPQCALFELKQLTYINPFNQKNYEDKKYLVSISAQHSDDALCCLQQRK